MTPATAALLTESAKVCAKVCADMATRFDRRAAWYRAQGDTDLAASLEAKAAEWRTKAAEWRAKLETYKRGI